MAARNPALTLYKNVLTELRRAQPKNTSDSPALHFVREQFRRYQVTGEKICRASHEMQHLGETYLCLVQSARRFEELNLHYKGRGERSIESSARMVGLTVPGTEGDN